MSNGPKEKGGKIVRSMKSAVMFVLCYVEKFNDPVRRQVFFTRRTLMVGEMRWKCGKIESKQNLVFESDEVEMS